MAECTRLDPNNPLLGQWATLALRNLLENCPENQQIVASLRANNVDSLSVEFLNKLNLEPFVDEKGAVKLRHL